MAVLEFFFVFISVTKAVEVLKSHVYQLLRLAVMHLDARFLRERLHQLFAGLVVPFVKALFVLDFFFEILAYLIAKVTKDIFPLLSLRSYTREMARLHISVRRAVDYIKNVFIRRYCLVGMIYAENLAKRASFKTHDHIFVTTLHIGETMQFYGTFQIIGRGVQTVFGDVAIHESKNIFVRKRKGLTAALTITAKQKLVFLIVSDIGIS